MVKNLDRRHGVSGNRPFQDILAARLSRRGVLTRGMLLSAAGFVTAVVGDRALAQAGTATATPGSFVGRSQVGLKQRSSLLRFNSVPIAAGSGPEPNISSDYQYETLIPWGHPIQPGGPEYDGDPTRRPTSAEQAQQIGIGHDGMWFFPMDNRGDRGIIAINHEFGRNPHVLGKEQPESLEEARISQHAHGVSIVEVAKQNGRWQVVSSDKARRIHANTPMTFSGPAAGHPLLQTRAGNPPMGTLNNCANGHTPWGTYLTCEENFDDYFGDSTYNPDTETGTWAPTAAQERYGFAPMGSGYGWYKFDPRFDLSNSDYANEENRFGWVVEIDPMNPDQVPVKRTALGRFKHEGVDLTVGRGGRIVGYMGDDERFNYLYKFVSAGNWRSMQARGISPLDEGTLYVARFNDDGTGEWLELSLNNPVLAREFSDLGEILVNTRQAADMAGATPMDRPEWTTVGPNGEIYVALTNNSQRETADAANPLAPNPDGHIIRFIDSDDHVGTRFEWELFIIAEETHGEGDERTFSDPDGLWADPDGRLFIQTDGGQKKDLNNQMLVADTVTGEIRRLFTGVTGCEVTGITTTPDRRTMFINVQHPGNGDPSQTNFPLPFNGTTIPRDATVVITRKDGGVIGA